MDKQSFATKDGNEITFHFSPEALIVCTCDYSKSNKFCKHISSAFSEPQSIFKNKDDVDYMPVIIDEYQHKQNVGLDLLEYFTTINEIEVLQVKKDKIEKLLSNSVKLTKNGLYLLEDFEK